MTMAMTMMMTMMAMNPRQTNPDRDQSANGTIPLIYLDVLNNGQMTSAPHLPMSVPYISLYFLRPVSIKQIASIRNKFKKAYRRFKTRFVQVEGYEHLYERHPKISKHNPPAFVPIFCLEKIMRNLQP
jgi:hypothetical protein